MPEKTLAVAPFISDSFTDAPGTTLASHVGEIGASWTHDEVTAGTTEIDSAGRLRSLSDLDTHYYASGIPTSPDYDVEWDIHVNSVPSSGFFLAAAAARIDTVTDARYEVWYDVSGLWSLYAYSSAQQGTLIGYWQGSIVSGATYHAKFSLRGDLLTLYVDGNEVIVTNDQSITEAGRVGLEMYNTEADGAGFVLDNISATMSVASSYTMTGPSLGVVNRASSDFTVKPDTTYTGTITPSSSGQGTFSPTSLSWSGESSAKTFTYTPSTIGGSPHIISTTSSPVITEPSSISYTVESQSVAPVGSFVFDSFTDTADVVLGSHIGEVGAFWSNHPNYPNEIMVDDGGRIRNNFGGQGAMYYASGVPSSADYTVQADVTQLSTDGDYIGVMGRVSTASGTYYWFDYSNIRSQWELVKSVDGVGEVLATNTESFGDIGTTHTLKLSMVGDQIVGYSDGVVKVSATDSSITLPGRAGIVSDGIITNTTGQHLNNFTAKVVSTSNFIPVSDSSLYWSHDNVYFNNSSYALMLTPGSYLKTNFTGTRIAIDLDSSALLAAGVSLSNFPIVRFQVDGGAWEERQVDPEIGSIAVSGLSSGSHSFRFEFVSTFSPPDSSATDKWLNPTGAIKVTGLNIDNGMLFSQPMILPKTIRIDGDSITEGLRAIDASDAVTGNSSYGSYAYKLAGLMGVELSQIGYGSQGWVTGWQGNIPTYPEAADYYYNGVSRLNGGILAEAPDYWLINEGTNDGSSDIGSLVKTQIEKARSEAGSACQIFVIIPFNGAERSAITANYDNYIAENPTDNKVHLIDLGDISFATTDGLHPSIEGHQTLAEALLAAINNIIPSISTSTTNIVQNSINNSIELSGVNTVWTMGNPGSPTFTLSGPGAAGASIVAQTINSATSATLTINAGSGTGELIITDPENNVSTSITVDADSSSSVQLAITSPQSGKTVDGNQTISFTDSDPLGPQCSIDNLSWVSCVSGATKLQDLTNWSSLSGGSFTLYLKDDGLNSGAGSISVLLVKYVALNNPSIALAEIKTTDGLVEKFKDTIRITTNKFKLKQQDPALANGTIKIFKGDDLWETVVADVNGAWSKTLRLGNNAAKTIKLYFYDTFGSLLGMQKAKIKVDTSSPKFKKFITPFYSIKAGETLYWEATDNVSIRQYKVYFNGRKTTVRKARFVVPANTRPGLHTIVVKAYDPAGNSSTKKTQIRVR